MAFTDTQKAQIRQYLGYPDVYRYANPRLEGALEVMGERPEVVTIVTTILANLATADAKVNSVLAMAGIKTADEVEFFQAGAGNAAVNDARRYGRMWAGRLSKLIGVPKANDAFSESGYNGDWWANEDIQVGGSGLIPLG
jgi:hypothetical protein